MEDRSHDPQKIKSLARELLATLVKRRFQATELKFVDTGWHSSGAKGDVVVATLLVGDRSSESQGERRVAVKRLRLSLDTDDERFLKAFANELRLLHRLSHPHIVEVVGFVEDIENSIAWIVFPWESNGNVREFLRSGEWEIPERVSLIRDVAGGLEYLHSRQPPICHGDLKSLNILVNDTCRAVITDFGSARVIREGDEIKEGRSKGQVTPINVQEDPSSQISISVSNSQLTLTGPSWSLRWAAPEIFNGEDPGLASDIWAFGWICWEVITDNYPFPETTTPGLITLMVTGGQLPPIYAHDRLSHIQHLCGMMLKCWKPEPKERLSAAECCAGSRWMPSTIPAAKSGGTQNVRSVTLLIQLGEMHKIQSRYEEASKMFEQALAIAEWTGDKVAMARAKLGLGDTHRSRLAPAKAEESYTQAMAIFTGTGSRWGIASALLRLGRVRSIQADYPKAEEFYNEALDTFTAIGDRMGRASALHGLGDAHRLRSRYAEAEEAYIQAMEIFTSLGNVSAEATIMRELGLLHRTRSEYPKAEEFFTRSLVIFTSVGNVSGQVTSSLYLAETKLLQAQYEEARSLVRDGAEIAERIDFQWGKRRSSQLLREILKVEKASLASSLSNANAAAVDTTPTAPSPGP